VSKRFINKGPTSDVKRKMAMATELNDQTPDQLRDALAAAKKDAFNVRFQAATNQLENTAHIKPARRSAARIKTILNQKAAAAAAE
jgi:large subunit ribosomal protein L29